MKDKREHLIEMIVTFAKKVLQYPYGQDGYDPNDEFSLKHYIEEYEKLIQ